MIWQVSKKTAKLEVIEPWHFLKNIFCILHNNLISVVLSFPDIGNVSPDLKVNNDTN